MTGWSANFMEREEKHHKHKVFAVSDAPAIILTLTSGRTGTHYLASLFSVLPNVYSVHEPEPTLSSRKLAQGELSTKEAAKLILNKSDSILATLNLLLNNDCLSEDVLGF